MTSKDEKTCFAEDVLMELDFPNWTETRAQNWVLRWMGKNHIEVNEQSTGQVANQCSTDFQNYIKKRKIQ